MEDIPVMPIVRELFEALPDWDVPELDLSAKDVLFFRDNYQVIRFKNGIATRYHAEFIEPRRYENGTVPGPYTAPEGRIVVSETVVIPRNATEELIGLDEPFNPLPIATYIDDPVANAQDGSEVKSEELPTYNFEDPAVWGGLPRERPVTGGYWRDEDFVYYQGLNDTEIFKYLPTLKIYHFNRPRRNSYAVDAN